MLERISAGKDLGVLVDSRFAMSQQSELMMCEIFLGDFCPKASKKHPQDTKRTFSPHIIA